MQGDMCSRACPAQRVSAERQPDLARAVRVVRIFLAERLELEPLLVTGRSLGHNEHIWLFG